MSPLRSRRHGDDEAFTAFRALAGDAARAAGMLEQLLAGLPDSAADLADEITAIEHDADARTQGVMQRPKASFGGVVDRESAVRLASTLDDIVDCVEDTARYLVLYRVEAPMVQGEQLAELLVAATGHLVAVAEAAGGSGDIAGPAAEVHRLETEGDQALRHAIAALFEARTDPMLVIRWKDIFERIEDALDATERATYLLQGIATERR